MHDDFAIVSQAAPGSELTLPDPENPGLYVSGFLASVDMANRAIVLNRAGKPPLSIHFPTPEPGTDGKPPEDEK